MIHLEWKTTRVIHTDPTEFSAEMRSGGRAFVKFEHGVWMVTVEQSGQHDQQGPFATVYDAQAAVEAEDVQRLASAALSHNAAPLSSVNKAEPKWRDH